MTKWTFYSKNNDRTKPVNVQQIEKPALLRLPKEKECDYQKRCESRAKLYQALKSWKEGQPLPNDFYPYPIKSEDAFYYPYFSTPVKI